MFKLRNQFSQYKFALFSTKPVRGKQTSQASSKSAIKVEQKKPEVAKVNASKTIFSFADYVKNGGDVNLLADLEYK